MNNDYLTDFIKQPDSQIVYNTFYHQKLIDIQEKDLDLPDTQYLSQTVNRNLKSIAVSDYMKFVTTNTFEHVNNCNNIVLNFKSYDNCLLTGFEVGIDKVQDSVITFKVYPGSAIIDTFLIELYEMVVFDFDTSANLGADNVIIVLDYIGRNKDSFSIRYYLLDDNLNSIDDENTLPWRNSYLPLSLFRINRDNDLYTLSLEALDVPFVLFKDDKCDTGRASVGSYQFTKNSNVVICNNKASFDRIFQGFWIMSEIDFIVGNITNVDHTPVLRQVVKKIITSQGEFHFILDDFYTGTSTVGVHNGLPQPEVWDSTTWDNIHIYNKRYAADDSLMYQFADIDYIDLVKNKTVLETSSLIPLYIPPKHYVINNIDYIIPNYGKQVNTGYEMANMLFIDKSPLAETDLNIPILKPTNNNLYNSMFSSEIFSELTF